MAGLDDDLDEGASIGEDEVLLRKVHPSQMIREDGVLRVTSNAFRDITDPDTGKVAVSVFSESKLQQMGFSSTELIAGQEGFGVVAVLVRIVRSLDLDVSWEPNERSFGEAHAHINGDKNKSTRRQLANRCEYRVWPEPVPVGESHADEP